MKILDYISDLEYAFRLDCSDEDIKVNKEARQTYKILRKIKKKSKNFKTFIDKQGVYL